MMKENPAYARFSLPYRVLLVATWLMGRPCSQETKIRWYDAVSRSGKPGDRINIYNTWFNQVGRLEFDKHITDGYILLCFEGREYMSIQGYDSYLTTLYGDYMQLPPEDMRAPTHTK